MNVTVDQAMAKRVSKIIENLGFNARKELRIAVNKTASKVESTAAKEIYKELATTQKAIKRQITIKRAAGNEYLASVIVSKSKKIPLKEFGARHVRNGVTYRVSRTQGRKTLRDAFMGPKPGVMATKLKGQVYARQQKQRKPIFVKYGPSPWGVFTRGGKVQPTVKFGIDELNKQVIERIRFLTLKSKNLLKGKQR